MRCGLFYEATGLTPIPVVLRPRRFLRAKPRAGVALLKTFERFNHPLHRGMRAVLQFDPIFRSASAIWSISSFRYQAFQPHDTGVTE